MTEATELDIVLERRKAGEYVLRLSLTQADSNAIKTMSPAGPVQLNSSELEDLARDPVRYGQALSLVLFADETANEFFSQAHALAQSQGSGLRVRLQTDAAAPELKALYWETLSRPGDGSSVATDLMVHFSRYISNDVVRFRSEGDLRGLVAVVGPRSSLTLQTAGWLPSPADVAAELALARACLGEIPVTELDVQGVSNLQTLAAHLREGMDILYLACQALLVDGEPWIWVDDDQAKPILAPAVELVALVRGLAKPPRLAALIPFQNAGLAASRCSSDLGALAVLAPALVEAGIPAAVAMQANVTQETARTFLSTLFQELRKDGQADRAVAEARAAVRDRADWWVPLLFTGHPSGRIWYVPGFAADREGLRKWPALLNNIKNGRCTLILGPYLFERVFGERRAMARRWADTYGYPLAAADRDSVAKVARYLAVSETLHFSLDVLQDSLRRTLTERYEGIVAPDASFAEALRAVAEARKSFDQSAPDVALAGLPWSIYITTDPSGLLAHSLRAVGKDPVVEVARWNESLESLPSIFDSEPDYLPTPQRPLVYLAFGDLEESDSVVFTEEDYYDYLIAVTSKNDLVPPIVRRSLVDSALLFVGFRADEWEFGVLRRSLAPERSKRMRRSKYAHMLQSDPEGSGYLNLVRATRYLEELFGDDDISIYWGSVEDFALELRTLWARL